MDVKEKINVFKDLHESFFDMVLDDTWLSSRPIDEEEMKECWHWAVKLQIEDVPTEKFEEAFGLSFKDLTEWWNQEVIR